MLQRTKRQVKWFGMHCFTMFITALCVIFLFTFILCIRKMQMPKFTQVILKYVKNWLSSKLAKRKYTL